MIVTIDVTNEDIDAGKPQGNAFAGLTDCMVARAIKRLITTDTTVYVTFGEFYFNRTQYKPLPPGVANKILQWCEWMVEKPDVSRPEAFSFPLDIPAEFLKMEIPQFKLTPVV